MFLHIILGFHSFILLNRLFSLFRFSKIVTLWESNFYFAPRIFLFFKVCSMYLMYLYIFFKILLTLAYFFSIVCSFRTGFLHWIITTFRFFLCIMFRTWSKINKINLIMKWKWKLNFKFIENAPIAILNANL